MSRDHPWEKLRAKIRNQQLTFQGQGHASATKIDKVIGFIDDFLEKTAFSAFRIDLSST